MLNLFWFSFSRFNLIFLLQLFLDLRSFTKCFQLSVYSYFFFLFILVLLHMLWVRLGLTARFFALYRNMISIILWVSFIIDLCRSLISKTMSSFSMVDHLFILFRLIISWLKWISLIVLIQMTLGRSMTPHSVNISLNTWFYWHHFFFRWNFLSFLLIKVFQKLQSLTLLILYKWHWIVVISKLLILLFFLFLEKLKLLHRSIWIQSKLNSCFIR